MHFIGGGTFFTCEKFPRRFAPPLQKHAWSRKTLRLSLRFASVGAKRTSTGRSAPSNSTRFWKSEAKLLQKTSFSELQIIIKIILNLLVLDTPIDSSYKILHKMAKKEYSRQKMVISCKTCRNFFYIVVRLIYVQKMRKGILPQQYFVKVLILLHFY